MNQYLKIWHIPTNQCGHITILFTTRRRKRVTFIHIAAINKADYSNGNGNQGSGNSENSSNRAKVINSDGEEEYDVNDDYGAVVDDDDDDENEDVVGGLEIWYSLIFCSDLLFYYLFAFIVSCFLFLVF